MRLLVNWGRGKRWSELETIREMKCVFDEEKPTMFFVMHSRTHWNHFRSLDLTSHAHFLSARCALPSEIQVSRKCCFFSILIFSLIYFVFRLFSIDFKGQTNNLMQFSFSYSPISPELGFNANQDVNRICKWSNYFLNILLFSLSFFASWADSTSRFTFDSFSVFSWRFLCVISAFRTNRNDWFFMLIEI